MFFFDLKDTGARHGIMEISTVIERVGQGVKLAADETVTPMIEDVTPRIITNGVTKVKQLNSHKIIYQT